jgi:DNA-binding transcriptional regulator YhcF (GntR family)
MNSGLLILDPADPAPPYEQIKFQIRTQIAGAQLPPGAALPSVRRLARDLGVSPNTVSRAYADLQREGWVVAVSRRGVAVADEARGLAAEERVRQLNQAAEQLLGVARRWGLDTSELQAGIDGLRRRVRATAVSRSV